MNSGKMKYLPLDLTSEQITDLEKLAGIAFPPEKIAMYFGIPEDHFMNEFNDPESKIRYHYDKGLLQSTADVNKGTLKRAKDGNLSSIAQLGKDLYQQKLSASKKRRMFDSEKHNYEQLQAFIEEGEIRDIPADQLEYFEQLDYIRSLYGKYESKSFILNAVQVKWPKLSKLSVNKLFSESLNFFYLDNEVKIEAWQNIYADQLDNMARICFDMNDFETGRRCLNDAAKMRGVGSEDKSRIPKDLFDRKPVFYTIRPEDVGIRRVSRVKIGQFIDELPILEKDKMRVKRDAGVEDVDFELVEENVEN